MLLDLKNKTEKSPSSEIITPVKLQNVKQLGSPLFKLLLLIIALILLSAYVLAVLTASISPPEHKFVSADGGFVMISGFKTPVEDVERSFDSYKFLRGDSKMQLYRTTQLTPFEVFSKARHYKYDPTAIKRPVDWYAELQQKCMVEYIPTLPVVLEANGIKFFFFNQYDNVAIDIYGISQGKLFALTIKNNPRNSASGKSWEYPVWSYTKGIDIQDPHWKDVWMIVNTNRAKLILTWERDRRNLSSRFDPHYDRLF